MAKNILNKQKKVDVPTLLLQNRNFDTIGSIHPIFDLSYTENFNSSNLLTFTIYKDSDNEALWEKITDLKIIYIPEFEERFEVDLSTTSTNTVAKSVTAVSLCESELSQVHLYHIEINTEADLLNEVYDEDFPTLFYRDPDDYGKYDWSDFKYRAFTIEDKKNHLKHASLLHRILEKAEHYTIGHIDPSLKELKSICSFSISDTDLYSELIGEISETYHCIFIFDSMTRTISAYDLYHTCKACGYRGDFSEACPKCSSKEFGGQYGADTTIFISNENLSQEISLESDSDSLKNCFYVEGGDEIITDAVRAINPNGTNYFYEFNPDTVKDMPAELSAVIQSYDEEYRAYNTTKKFPLSRPLVEAYNRTVSAINELFSSDDQIHFQILSQELTGYPSVISAIYEATDLYEFLENAMMPTISIDGLGIEDSIQSILSGFSNGFSTIHSDGTTSVSFRNQIAVRKPTTATLSTIENTIKNSAKMFYSSAYYTLEVNTLSYTQSTSTVNGSWRGTFTLTSRTETEENGEKQSHTSVPTALTITDQIELYTEQSIYHSIAKMEKAKYCEITNLNMDLNTFRQKLSRYALVELERLKEAFRTCLDVIISAGLTDQSLFDRYYHFYQERYRYIDQVMLPIRTAQLESIESLYYFDSGTNEASGLLYEITVQARQDLNLKEYITNHPSLPDKEHGARLWKTYCSYRREEKYTNSNYISDGLSNAELIEKAQELIDCAKKELYKASHFQYTLSSNLNNLLALEEFQPLADAFACGNWIRVGFEDQIYKLRLLSYQIQFEDLSSIDVTFSTVEAICHGNSDLASILGSAQSLAGSYSYTSQQVNHSAKYTKYVENWVQKGMDATATKIVNNAMNQDILMDRNGLLCRKYDDIENVYDPCQAKFINNGLYVTSDNWDTIHTGVGKFLYLDPKNNFKETVGYGVIADLIHSDIVLTSEVGIYARNGSVIIDGSGITLDGGKITWTQPVDADNAINSNAVNGLDTFKSNLCQSLGLGTTMILPDSIIAPKIGGGYLFIYNPDTGIGAELNPLNIDFSGHNSRYIFNISRNNSVVMGVTSDGDGYFRGKIAAAGGAIGGFTIGNHYLANNTASLGTTENSVYLGTDGISLGNIFQVSKDGKVQIKDNQNYGTGTSYFSALSTSGHTNTQLGSSGIKGISLKQTSDQFTPFYLQELSYYDFASRKTLGKGELSLTSELWDGSLSTTVINGIEAKFGGTIYEGGQPLYQKYESKGICLPLSGGTLTGNLVLNNHRFLRTYDTQGALCNLIGFNDSGNIHIGTYGENDRTDAPVYLHGGGSQYNFLLHELLPNGNGNYNLGSKTNVWAKVYAKNLRATDTDGADCNLISINSNNNIHIGTHGSEDTTLSALYLHGGGMQYNILGTYFAPNTSNESTLGSSAKFWKTVYAKTGTINTSDRKEKQNIQKIQNKYIDLFYKLKPKTFLFHGGDRIHVGAISQDIEEAMQEVGISPEEFGGFCKDIKYTYEKFDEDGNGIEESKKPVLDEHGNIVYDYAMRYQEFIFLCVEAIQRQKKKLDHQEKTIAELSCQMERLASTYQALQNEISAIKEPINEAITKPGAAP